MPIPRQHTSPHGRAPRTWEGARTAQKTAKQFLARCPKHTRTARSEEFMTERIPKRIIQTDKSADLPLLSKAAIVNLRLLNPDFEYLFFDDAQVEEFIDAEFPQYRPVFDFSP